jgi:hypothetical protein
LKNVLKINLFENFQSFQKHPKGGTAAMPRGGARPGSGRKKKPLAEKILDGNLGRRPIKVVDFGGSPFEEQPPEFLKLASKETAENYPTADQIYIQVSEWLKGTGVGHMVSPTLIEDFSINRRAYFECEYMNKRLGRIAGGKRSPYVDMAVSYYTMMRAAWEKIWAIVAQKPTPRQALRDLYKSSEARTA